MATGFDYNRMQMLLAVLEKRAGYFFGSLDAYINVVGGLKLDEPACDLPIALAMVSGLRDRPLPADMLAIGEIGLGGEIRSVIRIEDRVREAQRMGFSRVLVPGFLYGSTVLRKISDSGDRGVEYPAGPEGSVRGFTQGSCP